MQVVSVFHMSIFFQDAFSSMPTHDSKHSGSVSPLSIILSLLLIVTWSRWCFCILIVFCNEKLSHPFHFPIASAAELLRFLHSEVPVSNLRSIPIPSMPVLLILWLFQACTTEPGASPLHLIKQQVVFL